VTKTSVTTDAEAMGVALSTSGESLSEPDTPAADAVIQRPNGTRSMRILHIVTVVDERSSYGGPLTVAVNQCRELRRRGHDARIVAGWTGNGTPPGELEGVPVHLFPARRIIPGVRFSGLLSVAMLAWLGRNAKTFDVGHLHTGRDIGPLSAGALLRYSRVPYTTQTHGMVMPDGRAKAQVLDRLLTRRVLQHAMARFVLTELETAGMVELLGVRSTTVRLPNGIGVSDAIRTPDEPLDVLFMARLHPRKRVMDFANAAHALIQEGHDVRFSVVGPDDGDLPALMHFIALHPSLEGRLRYEGPISHDDTVPRLARAGIFVLPSVNEPFPMTLLEALAVGTPSICTTSCGVAGDLSADDAAVVIESGAGPLEVAMRQLIQDPARRRELSVTAQHTARARYSMQAVGNRLLTAYLQEARALA
jgi:glycosyltransferase involved in cell wall biosynthesis